MIFRNAALLTSLPHQRKSWQPSPKLTKSYPSRCNWSKFAVNRPPTPGAVLAFLHVTHIRCSISMTLASLYGKLRSTGRNKLLSRLPSAPVFSTWSISLESPDIQASLACFVPYANIASGNTCQVTLRTRSRIAPCVQRTVSPKGFGRAI
jgi:hypothetical protein